MDKGIHVFVGPTLPKEEILRMSSDLQIHPPVAQGDLAKLVMEVSADCIVIIDGYFDIKPSVSHKEILWALDQRIAIIGAGSMGALRAAELHDFGMLGVGKVFEYYRDTPYAKDDEVAIQHADSDLGFLPFNEPMINFRFTLESLKEKGLLREKSYFEALEAYDKCHYRERRLDKLEEIFCNSNLAEGVDELSSLVRDNYIDQKREDALRSLAVALDIDESIDVENHGWNFEATPAWEDILGRVECRLEDSTTLELMKLSKADRIILELEVDKRLLAKKVGVSCDSEQSEWLNEIIENSDLASAEEFEHTLKELHISPERFARLMQTQASISFLLKTTDQNRHAEIREVLMLQRLMERIAKP